MKLCNATQKIYRISVNTFYVLLTVYLDIILVNDQIDAQLFPMCLFQFATCFEQPCAHHQENHLYQYNVWYISLCVDGSLVRGLSRN
jgi:hypothetical protein